MSIFSPGPLGRRTPVKVTNPAATGIASNGSSPNKNGLDFYTPSLLIGKPSVRMSLTAAGRVGIGTTDPSRALEIDAPGSVELGLKSTDANGTLWSLQSTGTAEGGDASLNSTFQIIDRSLGVKRLEIDKAGVVSVDVLKINGGSDIAEPFDADAELAAGSVVVIDERSPGHLRLSDRPYDRKVAGVVSGAAGIKTGLTLIQLGGASPQNVVALSGRVFALADTSGGAIRTGDLLTTSRVPGRAMRASNLDRARGATLGKAMSSLSHGSGLVLVLVGLQ